MPDETLIAVGDWFAVGCLFVGPFYFDDKKSGEPCAQKFGVNIGVQSLAAMDVASSYILKGAPIPKTIGHFTALEIMIFLKPIFEEHGLPRVGIVLGSSVWMSSHELLMEEETRPRAEWLKGLEIEIPPMPKSEKDDLRHRLAVLGLRLSFGEEYD